MTGMSQIQRESLPREQGTQAKALGKESACACPKGTFWRRMWRMLSGSLKTQWGEEENWGAPFFFSALAFDPEASHMLGKHYH